MLRKIAEMLRLNLRLWPTLLVLAVVALTVRLGFWQRERAYQKEALATRLARLEQDPPVSVGAALIPANEIEGRRVVARGRFIPKYVVYLDNRPQYGQPGFYVLMPLALKEGGYVLVQRGWLPRHVGERTTIAPYNTPTDNVKIRGLAHAHPSRLFEL